MTATDTDGRYKTLPMAAGEYKVAFYDPSQRYAPQHYFNKPTTQTADIVTVIGGLHTLGIDAAAGSMPPPSTTTSLPPPTTTSTTMPPMPTTSSTVAPAYGTFSGTVTDTAGAPLAGIRVDGMGLSFPSLAHATTDATAATPPTWCRRARSGCVSPT